MNRKNENKPRVIQIGAILVIGLMLYSILVKVSNGFFQTETFEDGISYTVSYDFECKQQGTDSTFFIKAFIPQENNRQKIEVVESTEQPVRYNEDFSPNELLIWEDYFRGDKTKIKYTFDVHTYPQRFEIDKDQTYVSAVNLASPYVKPTEFIESDNEKIKALGKELLGEKVKLEEVLSKIFNHVYEIPVQPIKNLMTAVEAHERNAASCNGKSRLFVALCRSLGIPARVAGGIILNDDRKKTSHLWAEVLINDEWVTFDPLNGYYAYLPANYLEVYKGDQFLITRSSDMLFDYNYEIAAIDETKMWIQNFNMFSIASETGLSTQLLSLMLFLPIGALIVAIFRNVVGLKTFGVFLPVLIAISFTATGLVFGIVSFVGVLLVISLLNYPMLKMGILHVPKLVVMLSGVVFFVIILLFLGVQTDLLAMSGVTFFPIVILTISAEKYARIVVEEGFVNASKILLQTILVTLFCFTIVNSSTIYLLIMNFPELLLFIALLSLMLGKWIGLRVSEYKRFSWIIS